MKEAREKLGGKKNPKEKPHASLWHKCQRGDETEKIIYGLLVNASYNF